MTNDQEKLLAIAILGNNVLLKSSISVDGIEIAKHLIEFNNAIIEDLQPLKDKEEEDGKSESKSELEVEADVSDTSDVSEDA